MSKLEDLGKEGKKDFAVASCTDFKFYKHDDDSGATIQTDTLICLSHKQKEGESLEDFKVRVAETVYRRIEALYLAYPHEIEASGITIDGSSKI